MSWWPITRDTVAYGLTIVVLSVVIFDNTVKWYVNGRFLFLRLSIWSISRNGVPPIQNALSYVRESVFSINNSQIQESYVSLGHIVSLALSLELLLIIFKKNPKIIIRQFCRQEALAMFILYMGYLVFMSQNQRIEKSFYLFIGDTKSYKQR